VAELHPTIGKMPAATKAAGPTFNGASWRHAIFGRLAATEGQRMTIKGLISVCALAALAGCTTDLPVRKIAPGEAAYGYPYRLKFTQFDVAVTWRIVDCKSGEHGAMKFRISAEPKDRAAPDPDRFYAIDPRVLQGPFRTTEFTMEWYDDRSIKSVNSSVDDQTGTAIVDVLTGVAKLAGAALLPAGPHAFVCSDAVMKPLRRISGDDGRKGQEAIVKQAQQDVDDQTLIVTGLTADAASGDDKAKKSLPVAQARLQALTAVLAAEQKKLEDLVGEISQTKAITWPENGHDAAQTQPVRPDDNVLQEWGVATTEASVNVYMGLLPLEGAALSETPPVDGKPNKPIRVYGLPYREPRLMRLYICSPAPCGDDRLTLDSGANVIKASDVQVLQFGTTFYLPFRAQTFASIKSSAAFNQAGVLTSAGTQQIRGAGSGAAEAFKGGAEQVAAIVTGAHSAKTARLQAQADELKAQKALQDAKAALAPVPVDDKQAAIQSYQTDATLATAERSKIEAEQALAAEKALQAPK
jgi:hypothetical protein